MKVSFNWLKDYVDIEVGPKVLAEKLTMAGLEVGGWHEENNDVVFEIEITANRPDCLSVLGIAQEVAAATGKKLQIPKYKLQTNPKRKNRDFLKTNFITIQNTKDCAFYRGCLITGVKVTSSPEWLKQRIEALGVRPVNNIVDITNYCLLKFGQPLHAFDYKKINERVIVRRAKNKEKILTIDGKERELNENILVISDKNKAIAIAGIMGDKLSEVGVSTTDILLESAYFDPLLIRRASRQLGLSTDSSYRFERQVDRQRVKDAQDEAIGLICKIAGGKFVDAKQAGLNLKDKSTEICFDCRQANRILSLDISMEKIKSIFSSLGFSCSKAARGKLLVKIPPLRRDIKLQEDLIEELSRIYGYDKIVSTLPSIRSALLDNPRPEKIKHYLRQVMGGLGFNETINYSLLSKEMLSRAAVKKEAVRLRNPLSSEQECLRPTLLAGLLNCLAYNLNHKNADLKFFEIGHIFNADTSEEMSLGIIATGKHFDNWQFKKEFDFFSLKGVVQDLIERLGLGQVRFSLYDEDGVFSKVDATKIIYREKEVGIQGEIDKKILANFGIKNVGPVFYAEIFLKELCSGKIKPQRFSPLPVYPSIVRDLSLIVNKSVEYADIVALIEQETAGYLKNIKLVDVYKGEQIRAGCMGMTVSLEFSLPERTLNDAEVAQLQQRLVKKLKEELSVEIR